MKILKVCDAIAYVHNEAFILLSQQNFHLNSLEITQ